MKNLHEIKKEEKGKPVIGILRTYDHARLLEFLSARGVSLKQWIEEFNYRTRTAFLASAPAGLVVQEVPFKNITPTVGFQTITKFLAGSGSDPDELEVMVHAFGTDGTTPVDSDTTLGSESNRKLLSSKSYSGASAFYTAFYDLAEGNGTWSEMGLFANADAGTPDDGTLWDRSLISITKTGTQSLTIDYEDAFVNNE